MCKPYNGKMKEFKWRPGIFQKRLAELRIYAQVCGIFHDDQFHRTLKRLVLFADLEAVHIQPPCPWNYSLIGDKVKIGLMNTECSCGINTDKIHYVDMNELEFNEKGQVIFTADHDTDFGFGQFYEIEMWTSSEESKIHQLVEKMEKSNQKEKRLIRVQIVKFIDDRMAAYEQAVLAFELKIESKIIEFGIETQLSAQVLSQLSTVFMDSLPRQNHLPKISSNKQKPSEPKISRPKKVFTSRQKRLQADAIQAAKDAEEAKLKQLEKKKNDTVGANGKKKKKNEKTHFRKSQKPARL